MMCMSSNVAFNLENKGILARATSTKLLMQYTHSILYMPNNAPFWHIGTCTSYKLQFLTYSDIIIQIPTNRSEVCSKLYMR